MYGAAHRGGYRRNNRWPSIPYDQRHRLLWAGFDGDHVFPLANVLLEIFPAFFPVAVITKDGLRRDAQRVRLFLFRIK